MKSTSRAKDLRSVFQSDTPSALNAHIAQMCVLYEDLRIELAGFGEEELGSLDGTGKHYRQHYFLRRSNATLQEFSDALVTLSKLPAFADICESFHKEDRKIWLDAVKFFKEYKHVIGEVRNNVGGHFGLKAAKYAVMNFRPGVVGKFEVRDIPVRGTIATEGRLWFAGEIVAIATFRGLSGTTDAELLAEYDRLLGIITEGHKHATLSTTTVCVTYLWDRF